MKNLSNFNLKLHEVEETTSTNNDIKKLEFSDLTSGYCVLAAYQNNGKGQRGKGWASAYGQNLTFSFYLRPEQLIPSEQFKLLQCVALAVKNTIATLIGEEVKIKWPNDILVRKQKIAGILIENFIQSGTLNSVVGIGINVNQTQFPNFTPSPTSLKKLTGENHSIKLVLSLFEHEFKKLIGKVRGADYLDIKKAYRESLFAMGELQDFETPKGQFLVAEVIGVDNLGRLILNQNGKPQAYLNGELKWLFS